jgi:hypothetical protein
MSATNSESTISQYPQTIEKESDIFKGSYYHYVFFNLPKGLRLIDVSLSYLWYSVLYGEVFVSLAKKIIDNDKATIAKLPAELVQTTLALRDAFASAYVQVPAEYKEKYNLKKSVQYLICSPDILKLNLIYAFVPFTKSRKVLKYEKNVDSYMEDIIKAVFESQNCNKPSVVIVLPESGHVDYVKEAGIAL